MTGALSARRGGMQGLPLPRNRWAPAADGANLGLRDPCTLWSPAFTAEIHPSPAVPLCPGNLACWGLLLAVYQPGRAIAEVRPIKPNTDPVNGTQVRPQRERGKAGGCGGVGADPAMV